MQIKRSEFDAIVHAVGDAQAERIRDCLAGCAGSDVEALGNTIAEIVRQIPVTAALSTAQMLERLAVVDVIDD